MRFEPRLFDGDDPGLPAVPQDPREAARRLAHETADDLALSDDLAAMAEQLGEDALHIAATHPADPSLRKTAAGTSTRPSPQGRTGRPMRALVTAAAVLLAAVGSWLYANRDIRSLDEAVQNPPAAADHRDTPSAVRPDSDAIAAADPASDPTNEDAATGRLPDPNAPAVRPASLKNLTGSEIEAVLDLMEGRPDQSASI